MHGTIKSARGTNKSAVTNGVRLFAERLDLRTPRGRRFKDLIASYSQAVGRPTTAQVAIIRETALMQLISEDQQMVFLDTGKLDPQHNSIVNMMRKHMRTLGLFNAKTADADDDADDEIDPLTYARSHRKRATLDDEEDD